MQTFLPWPDFDKSLRALDFVRCRNQVRETKTLLRILVENRKGGWAHHPACLMWRGYEGALARYGIANAKLCKERGWQANTLPYFEGIASETPDTMPWWFGDEDFHRSHRSNLCRKVPGWYSRRLGEHEQEGYVWPVWNKVRVGGRLRACHTHAWYDIIRSTPSECEVDGIGLIWSGDDIWNAYQAPVQQ